MLANRMSFIMNRSEHVGARPGALRRARAGAKAGSWEGSGAGGRCTEGLILAPGGVPVHGAGPEEWGLGATLPSRNFVGGR